MKMEEEAAKETKETMGKLYDKMEETRKKVIIDEDERVILLFFLREIHKIPSHRKLYYMVFRSWNNIKKSYLRKHVYPNMCIKICIYLAFLYMYSNILIVGKYAYVKS